MIKIIGRTIVSVERNIMFDEKKYGALLITTLPRVIENEQELEAMEDVISELLSKGIKLLNAVNIRQNDIVRRPDGYCKISCVERLFTSDLMK